MVKQLLVKMFVGLGKQWQQFKCRNDIHDYKDSAGNEGPIHFHVYKCKHCGCNFSI